MSDPSANVDIEDVLSSIRRLVSNGPDKEGAAARKLREDERLVLTPSQRVDEAEEAVDQGSAGSPESGAAGVTAAHPPEIDPPSQAWSGGAGHRANEEAARDATDFARTNDADTEREPEPELETEPRPAAPLSDPLAELTGEDGDAEEGDPADTSPSDNWDVKPVTASEFRAALGVDETEDDPALDGIAAMFARHDAAGPSAWEPDGDDEDAFADGAPSPTLDWRDADRTEAVDESATADRTDKRISLEPDASEAESVDAGEERDGVSEEVYDEGREEAHAEGPEAGQDAFPAEAPEAPLGEIRDEIRDEIPDAGQDEIRDQLSEAGDDEVHDEVPEEGHYEVRGTRHDESPGYATDWEDVGTGPHEAEDNAFAGEDEAVLDEDALRDLVAEIVREELMGTLGERITRNVRKLVRREIHRALNSQDLD